MESEACVGTACRQPGLCEVVEVLLAVCLAMPLVKLRWRAGQKAKKESKEDQNLKASKKAQTVEEKVCVKSDSECSPALLVSPGPGPSPDSMSPRPKGSFKASPDYTSNPGLKLLAAVLLEQGQNQAGHNTHTAVRSVPEHMPCMAVMSEPNPMSHTAFTSELGHEVDTSVISAPETKSQTVAMSTLGDRPGSPVGSAPDYMLSSAVESEPGCKSGSVVLLEPEQESHTDMVSEPDHKSHVGLLSEPEHKSHSDLVSEPDHKSQVGLLSEPEHKSHSDLVSEPDHKSQVGLLSEPEHKPHTDMEPEHRALADLISELGHESHATSKLGAKCKVQAFAKSELAHKSQADVKSETAHKSQTDANLDTAQKSQADAKSETAHKSQADAKSETTHKSQAYVKSETACKSQTDAKSVATHKSQTDAKSDTAQISQADVKLDATHKSQTDAKSDTAQQSQANVRPDTIQESQAETALKSEADAKPAPEYKYQAAAKSGSGYRPQVDARPGQAYRPQVDVKSEPDYKPQADAKSQPDYKSQADAKLQPGHKSQADAKSQPDYKSQTDAISQPGHKSQTDAISQPGHKSQADAKPGHGHKSGAGVVFVQEQRLEPVSSLDAEAQLPATQLFKALRQPSETKGTLQGQTRSRTETERPPQGYYYSDTALLTAESWRLAAAENLSDIRHLAGTRNRASVLPDKPKSQSAQREESEENSTLSCSHRPLTMTTGMAVSGQTELQKIEQKVTCDVSRPSGAEQKVTCDVSRPSGAEQKVTCDVSRPSGAEQKVTCDVSRPSGAEQKVTCDVSRPSGAEQKVTCDVSRPSGAEQKVTCDVSRPSGAEQKVTCDVSRPSGAEQKVTCDVSRPSGAEQKVTCDVSRPSGAEQKVTCDVSRPSGEEQKVTCDVSRPSGAEQKVTCDVSRHSGAEQKVICDVSRPSGAEQKVRCDVSRPGGAPGEGRLDDVDISQHKASGAVAEVAMRTEMLKGPQPGETQSRSKTTPATICTMEDGQGTSVPDPVSELGLQQAAVDIGHQSNITLSEVLESVGSYGPQSLLGVAGLKTDPQHDDLDLQSWNILSQQTVEAGSVLSGMQTVQSETGLKQEEQFCFEKQFKLSEAEHKASVEIRCGPEPEDLKRSPPKPSPKQSRPRIKKERRKDSKSVQPLTDHCLCCPLHPSNSASQLFMDYLYLLRAHNFYVGRFDPAPCGFLSESKNSELAAELTQQPQDRVCQDTDGHKNCSPVSDYTEQPQYQVCQGSRSHSCQPESEASMQHQDEVCKVARDVEVHRVHGAQRTFSSEEQVHEDVPGKGRLVPGSRSSHKLKSSRPFKSISSCFWWKKASRSSSSGAAIRADHSTERREPTTLDCANLEATGGKGNSWTEASSEVFGSDELSVSPECTKAAEKLSLCEGPGETEKLSLCEWPVETSKPQYNSSGEGHTARRWEFKELQPVIVLPTWLDKRGEFTAPTGMDTTQELAQQEMDLRKVDMSIQCTKHKKCENRRHSSGRCIYTRKVTMDTVSRLQRSQQGVHLGNSVYATKLRAVRDLEVQQSKVDSGDGELKDTANEVELRCLAKTVLMSEKKQQTDGTFGTFKDPDQLLKLEGTQNFTLGKNEKNRKYGHHEKSCCESASLELYMPKKSSSYFVKLSRFFRRVKNLSDRLEQENSPALTVEHQLSHSKDRHKTPAVTRPASSPVIQCATEPNSSRKHQFAVLKSQPQRYCWSKEFGLMLLDENQPVSSAPPKTQLSPPPLKSETPASKSKSTPLHKSSISTTKPKPILVKSTNPQTRPASLLSKQMTAVSKVKQAQPHTKIPEAKLASSWKSAPAIPKTEPTSPPQRSTVSESKVRSTSPCLESQIPALNSPTPAAESARVRRSRTKYLAQAGKRPCFKMSTNYIQAQKAPSLEMPTKSRTVVQKSQSSKMSRLSPSLNSESELQGQECNQESGSHRCLRYTLPGPKSPPARSVLKVNPVSATVSCPSRSPAQKISYIPVLKSPKLSLPIVRAKAEMA